MVLALLLSGGGAAALASSAAVSAPAAEVVAPAPDEVVPAPSDRDVLRAAAIGTRVSVQRDAAGALVMVLPGTYDARTVEQVVPAPASLPPGTAWLLAVAAGLAVGAGGLRAARHRWAWGPAGVAAGLLAATGTIVVLASTAAAVAAGVLACAALAGAGLAGCRGGPGVSSATAVR